MPRTITHIALILIMLIAATSACGSSDKRASILPENITLQEGDIVFRRGTGVTSRIVATADIHGKYSHVGIVAKTDSGLVIVHAVPDEPDFPGDPDRVKAEAPHKFFSKFRAQLGAVARPLDTKASAEAARFALQKYSLGVLFDHNYSDTDTSKLYCCELITTAFSHAGVQLAPAGTHHVKLPGVLTADCTFPSDIYTSPYIKIISNF